MGLAFLPSDGGRGPISSTPYHTAASDNRIVRMPLHGRSRLPRRSARPRPVLTGIPQGRQPQRRAHRVRPRRVPLRDRRRRGRPRRRAGPGVAVGQDPADDARRAARRPATRSATSPGRSGTAIRRGIAWDAAGGLWAAEFGQNTWDELNRIDARRELRMAGRRGRRGRPAVRRPRRCSGRPPRRARAGSRSSATPLFLAALRGERLWSIAPATAGGAARRDAVVHRASSGGSATSTAGPDGDAVVHRRTTPTGAARRRDGDDRLFRVRLAPAG